MQRVRFGNHPIRTNAEADAEFLESIARPDTPGLALLSKAVETLNLFARGYHRVLRGARALADSEAATSFTRTHIAEALSYSRLQLSA